MEILNRRTDYELILEEMKERRLEEGEEIRGLHG